MKGAKKEDEEANRKINLKILSRKLRAAFLE